MEISKFLTIGLIVSSLCFSMSTNAEETQGEKVETMKNKATDSVKSTYREAEDKACEMIDGKLKCIGKKAVHKVKNISDKAGTKAKEIKDKID